MHTYQTTIAGTNFRPIEAQVRASNLLPGEHLDLRRDPTNIHDANAIQVWALDPRDHTADCFIGFVPRIQAAHLAPILDTGATFTAIWNGQYLIITVEPPSE